MMNIFKKIFGWIPLEQFLTFLMWVAVAAILGLFDFTTWRFNIYKFQDPAYWSEVSVLVALGIVVFTFALIKKAKKLKKLDDATNAIEDEIKDTIKKTDTSLIRDFTRAEHIERVARQYEANVRAKLINHLDRMPDKAVDIWNGSNEKAKRRNWWCRRRARLEYKVSKDYLEENRKNLKARVVKISPNFIITGKNAMGKKKNVNQNPSTPFKQAIKDNWLNFLLPSIFVAALLAFVVTASEEALLGIWLTVAIKMLLLLIQNFSGDYYAPVWLKATWVADTYFRRDLLLKFKNWIKDKLTNKSGGAKV